MRTLPDNIVRKIAAGEVVERPASVLKELVENSIDAGARTIDIVLEKAGKKLIRVRDDGTGIEKDDLERAFRRHSTSKIAGAEDLQRIATLGFRGEALFSIGSVADVLLRSITPGNDTGRQIHVRGGETLGCEPVAMNAGTDIEVRELFFNTPARRKFMKSDATEMRRHVETVISYSLVHTELDFSVTHNGRNVFRAARGSTLRERIAAILRLPEKHLLETCADLPGDTGSVRLVLGDMNVQRARKDMQYMFVNDRPVQSRGIAGALNRAFRSVVPPNVFPFFAVYVHLPAEEIDVNIHPTKRDVKIRNEHVLCNFLRKIAESALLERGSVKQVTSFIEAPPPAEFSGQDPPRVEESGARYGQATIFESEDTGGLRPKLADAAYIGVFLNKYLIFGTISSLLLIDQHAAHERITYEDLRSQMEEGAVETQLLLTPLTLALTDAEFPLWEEGRQKLEEMGFSTTRWDEETIAIHSYPQVIHKPAAALRSVFSGGPISKYDNDLLARRACRQSVTAGDVMNRAEAERLRDLLLACDDPFTCPHGRPTVVEMSERFLNRQFLRE